MSNDAITWAFRQALRSGPKFVLVILADFADDEHSCYPGIPTIAERAGTSESTARENVGRLVDAGLIATERRHRGNGSRTSNRYILAVDGPLTPEIAGEEPEGPANAGNRGAQAPETDDSTAGDRGAINPQRTPSSEPSDVATRPADVVIAEAFDVAWKHWPRKASKLASSKAFAKAAKQSGLTVADLVAGIEQHGSVYATWPAEAQVYIPHLATWLNGHRWADPLPELRGGKAKPAPSESAAATLDLGAQLLAEQDALNQRERKELGQ